MSTDWGFIWAQSVSGAICNARVRLPNGEDATGIQNPKIADTNNDLVWNYPTPPTDVGTGIAMVSCTYNGLSGNSWGWVDVGS